MSKKQLVTLGVIAGLLAIVFAVQRLSRPAPDLEEEMGLVALAPEGFLASDVSRIELYRGSEKNDNKVLLAREKSGWTVESAYKAPGKKDDIEDFLKKLKDIEGEFRSDDASVLADYGLAGEKALHVAVFKGTDEDAWLHLLVGRKEAYGSSFIRRDGEDSVYTVNVNLASEVGLWGDDDKAPESSHWVDKIVVDLDKDKIERVSLTTPDRSLVFEKREKKSEEEGEEKEEGEKEDKKEHEWIVAEGGPGLEFKKKGVDDILGALDSFEASDVVDPAKKKDYGLDAPGFRCEVGLAGGREKVLVAAREKPGEDAYMTVGGKDVVYKVADWKFDDLFPDANDLFELKGLDEDKDKDKVRKITLAYPSAKMELVKEDDEWKITSPSTGLEFKESEAENLAEDLAKWKPVDYADGDDLAAFGLAEPERKVSFVVAEEAGLTKHTISLGAEAKGVEGCYALLDGAGCVWIVGKWDVDKIMPKPKDFFAMDVADIEDDDITKVAVERDEDALELVKEGDKWKLSVGGEEKDCSRAAVSKYLGRFKDLEAADVLLGRSDLVPDGSKPVVTVTRKDGTAIELTVGKKHEGKTALRKNAGPLVFLIDQDTASSLAPPTDDLVKAAEEAEE